MHHFNPGETEKKTELIQASPVDPEKIESQAANTDQPILRNAAAKRILAAELLAQGLSDEAICRILNISTEFLPDKSPL